MNETPIIFIHYGDSFYLSYVFKIVKQTNYNKRIILLGDDENKKYIEYGIEHYSYKELEYGEEFSLFNKYYQFIKGKEHIGDIKLNQMVFKRWFYLYNFCKKENINKCWTFDTDTYILSNLTEKEKRYEKYCYTELAKGNTISGLINDLEIIKDYLKLTVKLFQDNQFINLIYRDLEKNPNWAFTEITIYKEFKRLKKPNSIKLNTIIENETFDDALAWTNGMVETKYLSLNVKQLYKFKKDIFCKNIENNKLIKMNSLNLSWLPEIVFIQLFDELKKQSLILRKIKLKINNRNYFQKMYISILRIFYKK